MPQILSLNGSASISVSNKVHYNIRQGNIARGQQDWPAAANAYDAALKDHPGLCHIWMLLAHMLREDGRHDEAAAAYEKTFALRPIDPEALIHLARMRRDQGCLRSAAAAFVRILRIGGDDASVLEELASLLAPVWPIDGEALYRAVMQDPATAWSPPEPAAAAATLERLLAAPSAITGDDGTTLRAAIGLLERMAGERKAAPAERTGMVFDVTDLIAHFRHSRLPTGIQRVQIEVVARALPDPALDGRVCCFVDWRDELVDIPGPLFMELARAATADGNGDDPRWKQLIARLSLNFLTAAPFAWKRRDRLVNMGTSWSIHNYFLMIRNAKRDFEITYVPMVYDLIPVVVPAHCVTAIVEIYTGWLIGVFEHADAFLAISRSTRDDLVRMAARLGHDLDAARIEVVPLDADFRQPVERALPIAHLDRWQLADRPYCLLVSTIESRKNHILALDAWMRLIDAHGAEAIPMLVCVGRNGWLNEAFFDRLARNPRLRAHVVLIDRASDDELALLYRRSRFTVYPSHYEGWGLPVTESLCHGRVPVVADNSSLREAAGDFGVFFESDSVVDLVRALETVIFDTAARTALERNIAERYRPRSWRSIAAQVTRSVAGKTEGIRTPAVPRAATGHYYPVALHRGTGIWHGLGSGEVFRAGTGWLWPEAGGCRTTAGGGRLDLRIDAPRRRLRLYLRLRGLESAESGYRVSAGGATIAWGTLAAGEERWVLADTCPPDEDDRLSITIAGDTIETIAAATGGISRSLEASIGVAGFALVERDDEAGRIGFLEQVMLDGPDRASAYARPRCHDDCFA